MLRGLTLSLLFGCALDAGSGPTPLEAPDTMAAENDVRCTGAPSTTVGAWRHTRSSIVAGLGDPHHRGMDLIATTSDERQVIAGKLAYSDVDKDLEDEDVSVFACFAGTWVELGGATTDDDGRFTLALTGAARLPAGMRDLYVTVDGDGTGAEFLAFIAAPDAPIIVSDVDGTLTSSENEYPIALASGGTASPQPDAAATLAQAALRGFKACSVAARGDRFTQATRNWFAANGFPRGPLRLPASIITIPGEDTVELKSSILASLSAFDLVAGIGNRASDVTAYTNAGLAPDRILIKLPEFTEELAGVVATNSATGFDRYGALDMAALTEGIESAAR